MYHLDDVEDSLSPSPTAAVVVVEYPYHQGGVLNYCNFEVYSLNVPRCSYQENHLYFIVPDVPIGRIICISLYPDVPIRRFINIIKSLS